jgi:hypothetical protein
MVHPSPYRDKDVEAQGRASVVENSFTADLELFKSVVDQHQFVTKMFWDQANFFVLFQGALLTVVAQSLPKGKDHPAQPWQLLVLSILGLVLALFWAWVAWHRVWIIAQWRDKVRHLDLEIDRHHIYEDVEARLDHFSYRKPTSVTRFLPWVLALGWIGLLILSIVWLAT